MDVKSAQKFLGVFRELIQDNADVSDQTVVVQIAAVNNDGTYNVYILPDTQHSVNNIINSSPYSYSIGDMAYLYKVRNQIASSFIIGGTKAALAKTSSRLGTTTGISSSSGVKGGTTVYIGGQTGQVPFAQSVVGATITSSVGDTTHTVTVDNVANAGFALNAAQANLANFASEATHAGSADSALTANMANFAGISNSATYAYGDPKPIRETYLNVANTVSQPETEASVSYSIVDSVSGITEGAHNIIPTGAAVYNFASTAAKIHVYPTNGVYPIVGASPVSGDSGASTLYANATSPTVNTRTGEINAQSLVSGAVAASVGCFTAMNIIGSATIANLTTTGTTTFVNATNVNITDQLIVIGANNTTALVTPAGIVVNDYDGSGHYGGILYDAHGYAYVGDVVLNEDGTVNMAASNLEKLATRASELTNNYISVWNNVAQQYEDGIDINNVLNMATTSKVPVEEASASYSVISNLETNQGVNEIPTAQAVANFASNGKSVLVTNKSDATNYYLVGTNVSSGQASMSVNTGIWYQPSTGIVHANVFDGNATTATTASNYVTSAGASANIAAAFASKQNTIPVVELSDTSNTITAEQLAILQNNDIVWVKGTSNELTLYATKSASTSGGIWFAAAISADATVLFTLTINVSALTYSLTHATVPLSLQNGTNSSSLSLTLNDGDRSYGTTTVNFKTLNNTSILGSGNIQLQTPLTFDTTPTANSANPVTSGGIYNYAVSNVSWNAANTALTVTKGGVQTCIASSQSEQEASTSYSIISNIDTASSPSTAIPTVQAVKDYAPVNAGEGISVANKTISLNVATSSALGGVKIGYSGTTDRTYAVTLDSANHAYVTVPWASTSWRPVYLNGSQILSNSTSSGNLGFLNGQAISLTNSGGNITIGANLATATTVGVVKPGSSLQVSAGTLDINLGHSNNWTAKQYFGNDVAIAGNFVVTGNTTYANVHNLNVENALITLANSSEYARPLTVGAGLFVANCAGAGTNTNVALVFDQNGIAYVGRANLTDGNVIVSENPGLIPLMGRDVQSNFTDGDIIAWSSTGKKSVDSGAKISASVSDSDALVPTAGAVYDFSVSNVAWNSNELQVTKGASVSCIATTQAEQSASASYAVITNLETNQGVNEIPTAQAVANFAASARTGSIAFSPDGTNNTTSSFASATYLVKTGVGYVNGNFVAHSTIARGTTGAISASVNLTPWLGAVTANFVGIGTDMTSNNDMSFRLAVTNGTGVLYSSAVASGHVVRFKIYC
jgi:hypothetical protein